MEETRTRSVRMAKADKDDLKAVLDFLNCSEMVLEAPRYSMYSAEDNWKDLDDDDPDKQLILKIRKNEARETGCSEEDVDDRIVMYAFLKRKFRLASCAWRRVYFAADLLIDNVCDPTEDCLAFYPGFNLNHVEPEQ
jgi:hypothetical protein